MEISKEGKELREGECEDRGKEQIDSVSGAIAGESLLLGRGWRERHRTQVLRSIPHTRQH